MKRSKQTKRALVSSALALVLCFVMLLGTTFAWFTDNASTSVNKVQAGTLDVALEMYENGDWVSAEGKTLDFVKASGAPENEAVLWEPGVEYKLPDIRIANKGNLALKYQVAITAVNGDTKLAEVLDVKLQDGNGSVQDCGTLKSQLDKTNGIVGEYSLAANTNSNTLHISLKMQESAGNTYQGLSIDGIAITVMAKQDTVEYDSNGNTYDEKAEYLIPWDGTTSEDPTMDNEGVYHITNAAQMVGLMNATQNVNSAFAGKTIVLDCDIDFGGQTIKGIGSEQCNFAGNFDGQNHTVSNFVIERSGKNYYAGLFNYVTGSTISNLTVENANVTGDSMVGAIVGSIDTNGKVVNCSVNNSTIIGQKKAGGAVGYMTSATVENVSVKNTTICVESTDDTQYGEVVGFENTGAVVNNISDENVTVNSGYAFVSSFERLDEAIKNGCGYVTLNTGVNNDTPPHDGGDSPYHPYIIKDQYTIKKGQELTIDLNGETYEASVRLFVVEDGGKLTIKSSKPGGKITINTTDPDFNYAKDAYGMQVKKGGILNIEKNVTIEMNVVGVTNPVALCLNNGTVNINGGELVVYDSAVFTNNISNFGTFNMNGGKITLESKQANGTSTGFALWGSGVTANLNAGSIEGKGLAYNKAVVTYFGESTVNIAEGFVINTTKGPNT